MAAPDTITIRRPDDWHVHLRDGAALRAVVPYTARQFGRAIIMPNLVPPVTAPEAAAAYRERIVAALPRGSAFQPLMTCYLTDDIDPAAVVRGHSAGIWVAAKLYPAHATTHSAAGVTDARRIAKVLDRMQAIGMPLLVHGEITDPAVDIFDREAAFIERVLTPMLADFPTLRVVFEHITTEEAAAFVRAHADRVGATITPHHLMINRNAIFKGGIRPHLYCLPIAKRERHRLALRRAATSGERCFFLGTDTAPHAVVDKESACGCAGVFNAPFAIEAYAQVFEEENALDKFEAFASLNGAAFYRLPVNDGTVTLTRVETPVPERLEFGEGREIKPFLAGESVRWRFASSGGNA